MPAAADVSAARIVAAGMVAEIAGGSQGAKQAEVVPVRPRPPSPPLKTPPARGKDAPREDIPEEEKKKKAKAPSKRQKGKKNKLKIPKTNDKDDPFLNRAVAFRVRGAEKPEWLDEELCQGATTVIQGVEYLFGNVVRKEKRVGSSYIVEWEHTSLGTSVMDIFPLVGGTTLADSLRAARQEEEQQFPLTPSVLEKLTVPPSLHKKEAPLDSEDDDEEEEEGDYNFAEQGGFLKNSEAAVGDLGEEDLTLPSLVPYKDATVTYQDEGGLAWKLNAALNPPLNVSRGMKTKLIEEKRIHFVNPLSSFLAFVPLEFWKLYLFRTNTNGRYRYSEKLKKAARDNKEYHGRKWKDLSMNEFMTFFGLLIDMALRPTPGKACIDRWDDPSWHPYVAKMDRHRFNEIRSVLYMSEILRDGVTSTDALFKIRPLLNSLKLTLGNYVVPGSELSLDESSIACRSKYGRSLIFYNNTKPCGKYHFRFYVVTDTDEFVALRLGVHTKNDSDYADGYPEWKEGGGGEKEEALQQTKLTMLVSDMARPWFHTGRVLNMDNYYTSVEAFGLLKDNGLYARGTCRTNRRYFPEAVQFTKTEATAAGRGAMKVVTDVRTGMVAMGWVDGNPVHFLTTADGTEVTTVKRRVGNVVSTVRAPAAIRRFNHGMQGVDRFDQLVSLFSLAKQHAFKKYYNKLAMGLFDFALVNAELHYFMANPEAKGEREHRYKFRKDLCRMLYDTDWNSYTSDGPTPLKETPTTTRDPNRAPTALEVARGSEGYNVQQRWEHLDFKLAPGVSLESPPKKGKTCDDAVAIAVFLKRNNTSQAGLSYGGAQCQVCSFEGRKHTTKNVVICRHGVRACAMTPGESNETKLSRLIRQEKVAWVCPTPNASCLQKLHHHYIPRGLFGQSPSIEYRTNGTPYTIPLKRTCQLYKDKISFLLEHKIIAKAPRKGGRPKKKSEEDLVCVPIEEDEEKDGELDVEKLFLETFQDPINKG